MLPHSKPPLEEMSQGGCCEFNNHWSKNHYDLSRWNLPHKSGKTVLLVLHHQIAKEIWSCFIHGQSVFIIIELLV